jgi:thioredoxin 1
MSVIDLNDSNFDDVIETSALLVLDFWAEWCGPCGVFAPIYERAAERHPDVVFARINIDSEPTLAKQFEIFSVPTLLTAKDGTIVYARPGSLTEDKLEKLISELRKT